jgi:hypothetical protein
MCANLQLSGAFLYSEEPFIVRNATDLCPPATLEEEVECAPHSVASSIEQSLMKMNTRLAVGMKTGRDTSKNLRENNSRSHCTSHVGELCQISITDSSQGFYLFIQFCQVG